MTAPAVEVKDGNSLRAFLMSDAVRKAIEPMLVEGQKYERIVREVVNAAAEQPGILECELGSIVRAVSKAVTYDLEIGQGVFLVPRKDKWNDAKAKLRPQIGYKGKIELMLRYRAAKFIDYHCIYENEVLNQNGGHYRIEFGTNPFIEHKPIRDPAKRGALVGGYAFAQMTQVHAIIVEMDRSEVDAIRQDFSQQWKTKWEGSGQGRKQVPLPLDEIPWYVEARCVHRLSKKVPMRGTLASLIADADGDDDEIEDVEVAGTARRELGAGAAEPIRSAAGPGLEAEPVERQPAAGGARA